MPILTTVITNLHRGQYAERNAARTPWNHQVDIKIIYETKFHKISCSLLLIFFNVGNLVNRNWGTKCMFHINNSGCTLDFVMNRKSAACLSI
jgi:hypothetical protein